MKLTTCFFTVILLSLLFSCSKKDDPQVCLECPVVTSISPTIGKKGDTVTINGTNFSPSGNRIRFNTKETKVITETATSITAYVPANCGTGGVTVERADNLLSNNNIEFTEIYSFTVSTYAGMPGNGYHSDGSITYCFLNTPSALAFDHSGNLFICDEKNYCIRQISGGTISTVAGKVKTPGYQNSPDPKSAMFNTPVGLAITPSNVIYISDHNNHSIRSLVPIGFVTPVCGDPQLPGYANGSGAAAQFNYPGKLMMLDNTTFLVADSANNRIRKATINGDVSLFAGSGKPGSENGAAAVASFNNPGGMTFLDSKTLLIADAGNNLIRKIDVASGSVSAYAGYGKSGFLNGTLTKSMFNSPSAIAVRDMNGKKEIFIADTGNNMIRMIDSKDNVSTIIGDLQPGSQNGDGVQARLFGPTDLVFDPANNGILYIADRKNHTIRKVIIE